MTAPTPPLVDVIAAAILAHKVTRTGHCECGTRVHPFALPEDVAAHQARAVLAAIEQAGGVEWGVRRVGYPAVRQHSGEGSARWTVEECALEGHPEQVVSRITGPWERAE